MVESLAYKASGGTVLASTTRGYQGNRDLLASVQNVVQGTPEVTVSKYAYQLDPLGRRTSVVQTGTAFGQDHLWNWSYNDRSELIGADRREGTLPNNPGNAMTPGEYTYNYDPIGNRLMHRVDNDASRRWYCANNVNQYTAIDDGVKGAITDYWHSFWSMVCSWPCLELPGRLRLGTGQVRL